MRWKCDSKPDCTDGSDETSECGKYQDPNVGYVTYNRLVQGRGGCIQHEAFSVWHCWICWPLIAILLVWLFGRKRFWLTAPNDRCWSTRHKMRKSLYQKHQMQLVAHVAACCMLHAAYCWLPLVAVHLAPATPPPCLPCGQCEFPFGMSL